jgi:hypothetical protein
MSTVALKLPRSELTLFNTYCPPSSLTKPRDAASMSQFLEDFQTFISVISTPTYEFLNTGSFNSQVDDPIDYNA